MGKNRNALFFQLCTWVFVFVFFMIFTNILSAGNEANSSDKGQSIYDKFCAKCHGPKGKGDGDTAKSLNLTPADLSQLSSNNKGAFPMDKIVSIIKGTEEVKGHGSPEMPTWGKAFAKSPLSEEDIQALAHYIRSLQVAGM